MLTGRFPTLLAIFALLTLSACASTPQISPENQPSAAEESESEATPENRVPHINIHGEIYVDDELVSSPRILTLNDHPVSISLSTCGDPADAPAASCDVDGEDTEQCHCANEMVLALEMRPIITDDGQIQMIGTLSINGEVAQEIDQSVEPEGIFELSSFIHDRTYLFTLTPTVMETPESEESSS